MKIRQQIVCERPELPTKESSDSKRAHLTHAVAILKVKHEFFIFIDLSGLQTI